jgi:hypothetical protein
MNPQQKIPTPYIPVPWGELIDKITILEIKCERLDNEAAIANAGKELSLLRRIAEPVLAENSETKKIAVRLKALNEELWDIEDRIRGKEAAGQFDPEFIELARAIYRRNDERGALKRQMSLLLTSELVEEKSYKHY